MVRTAIDPEKLVSDDRHRDPARGGGHRDDDHEEEILQADSDTKIKKVTNKHHQRIRTRRYKYRIIGMDEVQEVRRPYFVMGSGELLDAQCARRDDEEPMIRREHAVEEQLQEGDAWSWWCQWPGHHVRSCEGWNDRVFVVNKQVRTWPTVTRTVTSGGCNQKARPGQRSRETYVKETAQTDLRSTSSTQVENVTSGWLRTYLRIQESQRMTMSRWSKAPPQTSTSLCAIQTIHSERRGCAEPWKLSLAEKASQPPHSLDDMVNSTVALYNNHSTRQWQGGGCHCSDAETGSQQSDHSEDREDPQVQHIEIKEVPDRARWRDDAEKKKCRVGSEEHRLAVKTVLEKHTQAVL